MPGRDVIVVAASAGGVEALKALASHLPADLPAAVLVVLHVPPDGTSVLPQILARAGRLPAAHAVDGEPIRPGRIYVAPPNFHLLTRGGAIALSRGPRENGHRPAADALFRAAARSFGRRVCGVVLSGTLDDGSAGLVAVRRRGGVALVQDPDDALFPGMPRNALAMGAADHVGPVPELAAALGRLARTPLPELETGGPPVPDDLEAESEFAAFELGPLEREADHPGVPSGFGCPDCGGALWELRDGDLARYRCRVGHAWSPHGLIARQADALEEALWVAMRALEERAALSDRLAERMGHRGTPRLAGRYAEQAGDCRRQAGLIREILTHPPREVEHEAEAGHGGDNGTSPAAPPAGRGRS